MSPEWTPFDSHRPRLPLIAGPPRVLRPTIRQRITAVWNRRHRRRP